MERYSHLYLGYDIDWFAVDHNAEVAFFASGGGRMPMSILENFDNYSINSGYFLDLPDILDNEVIINPSLEQIVQFNSLQEKDMYLKSYIDMAKKGLYCYDKTINMADTDNRYHLVVRPSKPINVNSLPQDYISLLLKTKYPDAFKDAEIINLVEFIS